MMFDSRSSEADVIKRASAETELVVRYSALPASLGSIGRDDFHHYDITRELGRNSYVLAQRLSAAETIAFVAGYPMGRVVSRSAKCLQLGRGD